MLSPPEKLLLCNDICFFGYRYAETKAQNRLIDEYIENSALKFKRLIHKI